MEETYIRKVCQGDADSFRYILESYKDMAFSLASSIVKDQFAAEEVVQVAFIKAYNNLKSFNGKSKFSTWFYRIVVNESFAYLKARKREIIDFTMELDDDIADESDLLALKNEHQDFLINEGLKRLPPNESLALRLFYLQEENIKSVCEITGWSASNAKVILHRGRKNMFAILTHLLKSEIQK